MRRRGPHALREGRRPRLRQPGRPRRHARTTSAARRARPRPSTSACFRRERLLERRPLRRGHQARPGLGAQPPPARRRAAPSGSRRELVVTYRPRPSLTRARPPVLLHRALARRARAALPRRTTACATSCRPSMVRRRRASASLLGPRRRRRGRCRQRVAVGAARLRRARPSTSLFVVAGGRRSSPGGDGSHARCGFS